MANYTNFLSLTLPGAGEYRNAWNDPMNRDLTVIDQWAMAFIGIRLAYIASYLMDKAALRSLIWMAGVAVCIYIMSLAG